MTNTTPVLAEADLVTDSDIQSLTREDLNELLPGANKLKVRRKIFEIIQKQVSSPSQMRGEARSDLHRHEWCDYYAQQDKK